MIFMKGKQPVYCKKYKTQIDIVKDKTCEFYEECIEALKGKSDD